MMEYAPLVTTIALSQDEWVIVIFAFVFLVFLMLGFARSAFWHIFAAFTLIWMAFSIYEMTSSEPLSIIVVVFAILLMANGVLGESMGESM